MTNDRTTIATYAGDVKIANSAARMSEALAVVVVTSSSDSMYDCHGKKSSGMKGSTGTVLHRSLLGLRTLIGRSLAEVRLTHGVQHRERLRVREFIKDLAPAAHLEAQSRAVTLVVMPVDDRAVIEGDRQVLTAVVSNLLQNAFKFTAPGTTVTLRVSVGVERVLIEVQDECGGLVRGTSVQLADGFAQVPVF